ncbi:octopamine receptor Oamb-like [Lineus longissimus]|uniref:octopamine receptor Oamb-like n=1 Tax=Lineus longissimus TaxID=88925 RepID=UPI00315C7285
MGGGLGTMPVALSVINLLMCLSILFGNSLVIAAVAKFQSLRTNMYIFMCNLAVADILVGIAIGIFTISNLVFKFKMSNIVICLVVHFLIATSIYCTLLNIACIAVDCSLAVNHPLRYHLYMTPRNVTIIISGIWAFSILTALCMFAGRTEWKIEICNYQVIYMWGYKIYALLYMASMSIIQVILYTQLVIISQRQIKRIAAMGGQNQAIPGNIKTNNKSIKMFATVVGLFIMCWLPLIIVMAIYLIKPEVSRRTEFVVTYAIACLSSALNPMIYACRNTQMRRAFKKLLHLRNNSIVPEEGANDNSWTRT